MINIIIDNKKQLLPKASGVALVSVGATGVGLMRTREDGTEVLIRFSHLQDWTEIGEADRIRVINQFNLREFTGSVTLSNNDSPSRLTAFTSTFVRCQPDEPSIPFDQSGLLLQYDPSLPWSDRQDCHQQIFLTLTPVQNDGMITAVLLYDPETPHNVGNIGDVCVEDMVMYDGSIKLVNH